MAGWLAGVVTAGAVVRLAVGDGAGGAGGVQLCSVAGFGVSRLGQSNDRTQVRVCLPAVEHSPQSVQPQVSWVQVGTDPPPPPPAAWAVGTTVNESNNERAAGNNSFFIALR